MEARSSPEYALLDRSGTVSSMFYPRHEWWPPPPGASDHLVPVAEGVRLTCRYYPADDEDPCILYFHGNGEIAFDYDWVAPAYNERGLALLVADYRGYGASSGLPTFANMIADAHPVLDYVLERLASPPGARGVWVMGRSLGSHPAAELAARRSSDLEGLIVESGFATMGRRLERLLADSEDPELQRLALAHRAKIASIALPTLIIHGQADAIVPPSAAEEFYEAISSTDKRLLTIPGAGHNDILQTGWEQYMAAISSFTRRGKTNTPSPKG